MDRAHVVDSSSVDTCVVLSLSVSVSVSGDCVHVYVCVEKVAHCLPGLQGSLVVELNPGLGVLTRALLNAGAQQVIALEHERKCFLPAMKVCQIRL